MKTYKYITTVLIIVLTSNLAYSQGFFRPVPKSLDYSVNKRGINDTWLIRPTVQLTAMQIMFGETTEVKSLSQVGTGISYAHFIDQNGLPYQNFSADLIVLYGTEFTDVAPLKLSLALSVTAWQYLSFGGGYSFSDKKFFLLTGITYRFN